MPTCCDMCWKSGQLQDHDALRNIDIGALLTVDPRTHTCTQTDRQTDRLNHCHAIMNVMWPHCYYPQCRWAVAIRQLENLRNIVHRPIAHECNEMTAVKRATLYNVRTNTTQILIVIWTLEICHEVKISNECLFDIFQGHDIFPVSYTHLTLPTKRIV